MTWTYSGDPSSTDRDTVRFLVSDTDTNAQLVSDEEIAWALTEGGVYNAAAIVARAISAQYARKADFEVSKDLKVSYSKQATAYSDLASSLENKASAKAPMPYAGGISIDDKVSYEGDTDRVKPAFHRSKFMDNDTDVNLTADSED